MNNTIEHRVDIRYLKSGHIRLRFKLSDKAKQIVDTAIRQANCNYQNAALDGIALNFLACIDQIPKLKNSCTGNKRFLVKLHSDQYETVRHALDIAREHTKSDNDALTLICQAFIHSESFSHTHPPGLA